MNDKNEPTLEELVQIAKQEPSVALPRKFKLNEMEHFIQDMPVEEQIGNQVDGQTIYWCYREWCRDVNRRPKSNRRFFKEFRKHFKQYEPKPHGGRAYQIKSEPFELTEQEWWDMKKWYRASRDIRRRRKEQNSKKQSQKSGSEETI